MINFLSLIYCQFFKDKLKTVAKENHIVDLLFGKILPFACFGLGLFLNSMGIWILVGKDELQTLWRNLLTFLLICDSCFIVVDSIIACYYELGLVFLVWILPGVFGIKEIFYLCNILITIALSYERYVHIRDKSGYKAQLKIKYYRFKRLTKYIAVILITSAFLNCLSFFTYKITTTSIDDSDDYELALEKTELRKNKWYLIFDKSIKWTLIYVITLIALIIFNVRIYISVKESYELQEKLRANLKLSGNYVDLSSAESERKSFFSFVGKVRKLDKISFALFLVVAVFLCCNVCYVGEEMLKTFGFDSSPNYLIISRFMRLLNACINVLVYSFADKRFKNYLKKNIWHLLDFMFCSVVRYPKTIATGQTESTSKTNTSQDPRRQLHEYETKI